MSQLGLIGCGLIGSSFSLAAQKNGCFDRVVGLDTREEHLSQAVELGIVEERVTSFEYSDAICVAVPTSATSEIVSEMTLQFPQTPVFDVGSVKGSVLEVLPRIPSNFVPCHPLAGSHKSGPAAATADLFEGKVCVISPADETDPLHVEQVKSWWEAIGSRIRVMTPENHDRAVALTSHVPHLMSVVLAKLISEEDSEVRDLVGSGFKDLTRIAAGDPDVWRDIFQDNQVNIRDEYQHLVEEAVKLQELINTSPESLRTYLDQVATFRRSLENI